MWPENVDRSFSRFWASPMSVTTSRNHPIALPLSAEGQLDLAAAPRRALVVTLQLGALLAAGIPLIAVTQPFVPALPSAILLGAAAALLGIAFWRTAANLQGHVQAGSEAVIEALRKQAAAPESGNGTALTEVEQLLPGLGTIESIRLHPQAPAVGRSLSELNLRGITGATVLAIRRQDQTVVVPTAGETLREGDVLALTGSHEAIESARALLREGHLPDDI
jgi:CPA2 family monovalent cation:H+ antiporter-2